MCQLLETIKLVKGKAQNLEYHQRRFDDSRQRLFNCYERLLLAQHIQPPQGIAALPRTKCRILYREKIEKIEYLPYQFPSIRKLRLVFADWIEYPFKYVERGSLERLYALRQEADDILIVKKGLLTDSSFANLVFYDGSKYYTPAHPLLAGTKRQRLLDEGRISPEDIAPQDLKHFKEVFFINSMLELEDMVGVKSADIIC